MTELSRFARTAAREAVRSAHPEAEAREQDRILLRELYGDDEMARKVVALRAKEGRGRYGCRKREVRGRRCASADGPQVRGLLGEREARVVGVIDVNKELAGRVLRAPDVLVRGVEEPRGAGLGADEVDGERGAGTDPGGRRWPNPAGIALECSGPGVLPGKLRSQRKKRRA
jgi:hypothetical protein